MGNSGSAIIDFGAFPGQSDTSIVILDPDIVTGSLVEAWILPTTTADHSPDEHVVESIAVYADQSSIIANTSFVIKAVNKSQLDDSLVPSGDPGNRVGGEGTKIYGKFQVGWVWV